MPRPLAVKVFADSADYARIQELNDTPWIGGFTTNPSLMKRSGIRDYVAFAHSVLALVRHKPISFEVFADEFEEMEEQALEIASWGPNVYVKIPVTNTQGTCSDGLIARLSARGVKVNVTALLTIDQVKRVMESLDDETPSILSLFAGRIADTGRDPLVTMRAALHLLRGKKRAELLWASPREIYNLVQAENIGCHIITLPTDLLSKVTLLGKDLEEFSLETVKTFYQDAQAFDYSLKASNI